jgi:hypothetical protein
MTMREIRTIQAIFRCGHPALFAVLLALPTWTASPADTPAGGPAHIMTATPFAAARSPERISTALRLQIAAAGSADAVVFLDIPRATSRPSQRAEVARAQDEVLAIFGPARPRGLYRFSMVPAFAARLTAMELSLLESSPRVTAVGPNLPGGPAMSQSIPLVGGDRAHRVGLRGNGVVVAVLDSGINSDDPDFAGALVGEHCFCQGATLGDGVGCCPNGLEEQSGAGAAEDDNGHGSNVTGIILSRGEANLAATGMAPAAQVVAVKVFAADGTGFLLDFSKGLDWVLANRPDVRVVNMSLASGTSYTGPCDDTSAVNLAMGATITTLRNLNNATTFASSGNKGLVGAINSPACLTDAVAVGAVYDFDMGTSSFAPPAFNTCTDATTAPDMVACFSNTEDIVKLLAPGCRIVGPSQNAGLVGYCGTSQACPHAVGAAALLLEREPFLMPAQIVNRLQSTGTPVFDARIALAFPRVDIAAALLDLDDDGVDDPADNCPETLNSFQEDQDGDRIGDACDNCPTLGSQDLADSDHDGLGDPCDGSPDTFAPETLFVVDPAAGGRIYQLHRGTGAILNSFPTPEPVIGGGSGLAYSSRRASLFYTNGTTVGVPTIYELDPTTGAVLDAFPQASINGHTGITGLGASAYGLVSVALQTGGAFPELFYSPYDGGPGITGGTLGETGAVYAGQAAVDAKDSPPSFDDHAFWLSRSSTSGVPAPAVRVNQMQLFEPLSGATLTMERFRAPSRCVSAGPNAVLETPAAGDDVVVANEIQLGPNGTCDTLVGTGDDLTGCIDAGPDGVVNTAIVGDDVYSGRTIAPGANRACNTTVPAGDDTLGGILERPINGLGATGSLLFASTGDPSHDVLYVLDAYAPPITTPRSGPVILQTWMNPTPSGPIEAIAAGPTDTDFDGVINDLDDCRAIANPGQSDVDADKVGDACDNCPLDPNPDQADFDADSIGDVCDPDDDNDGVADTSDCGPLDARIWATPGEAANLRLEQNAATATTTLTWDPPSAPGATAIVYDLLRTTTPSDFTAAASCLESDDGTDRVAVEATAPALGGVIYFLPRAQNACPAGEGPLGTSSSGVPRAGRQCP